MKDEAGRRPTCPLNEAVRSRQYQCITRRYRWLAWRVFLDSPRSVATPFLIIRALHSLYLHLRSLPRPLDTHSECTASCPSSPFPLPRLSVQ